MFNFKLYAVIISNVGGINVIDFITSYMYIYFIYIIHEYKYMHSIRVTFRAQVQMGNQSTTMSLLKWGYTWRRRRK